MANKETKELYRVSYIDSNNAITHKSGFKTSQEAKQWLRTAKNITPLKLLVWDDEIDCYSTVEVFNTNYGNATATSLLKTVYI